MKYICRMGRHGLVLGEVAEQSQFRVGLAEFELLIIQKHTARGLGTCTEPDITGFAAISGFVRVTGFIVSALQ